MNKDNFGDASSDDWLWKHSQVMSQEILKSEEAMYLQMIKQPSELEGLWQGRQETERWKLGNVFIFISSPVFSETLLTLLEETRKHSGIIFGCFQSDNFHLSVTHEMETMHSAWLPEKEYRATKMYIITTGHSPSRQQLSFQSMEN
ncbi:unnamed protein product [Sphagnum tenellum]